MINRTICGPCCLALTICILAAVSPGQTERRYTYDQIGSRTSATGIMEFQAAETFDIRPRRATAGDRLNLYGVGFPIDDASMVEVRIGGVVASVLNVGSRVITIVVPSGSSGGNVELRIGSGAPRLVGSVSLRGLSIAPANVALGYGQAQQFTPTLVGSSTAPLEWAVNGIVGGSSTVGTISNSGRYVAPSNPTAVDYPFVISARAPTLDVTAYAVVTSLSARTAAIQDEVRFVGNFGGRYERYDHTFTASEGDVVYAAFLGQNGTIARRLTLRDASDQVLGSDTSSQFLRIPNVIIPSTGTYNLQVETDRSFGSSRDYVLWIDVEPTARPRGTWMFPAGGDWNEAGNWAGGLLPRDRDPVIIDRLDPLEVVRVTGAGEAASITTRHVLEIDGGTLEVTGELRADAHVVMDGGTLVGANVIATSSSALLRAEGTSVSRLTAITADIPVRVDPRAQLTLRTCTLRDAVEVADQLAVLGVDGDGTRFESQVILSGSGADSRIETTTSGLIVFGPTAELTGTGFVGPRFPWSPEMEVLFEGTLRVDDPLERLTLAPSDLDFVGSADVSDGEARLDNAFDASGTAVLSLSGGHLIIGGASESSIVAAIAPSGGQVTIDGILTNAGGATLSAGARWFLAGGVLGGTLAGEPGVQLEVPQTTGARMDGVTVSVPLVLPGSCALTLSGSRIAAPISFTGSFASLVIEGKGTVIDDRVDFLGASRTQIEMRGTGSLTLGPNAVVAGRGAIGRSWLWSGTMDLVNEGRIIVDATTDDLAIEVADLDHRGYLIVRDGQLSIRNAASPGGLGMVEVSGGRLALGGLCDSSLLARLKTGGGTIRIDGTITNQLLDLGGSTRWELAGILRGGTVISSRGACLTIPAGVLPRLEMLTFGADLEIEAAARLGARSTAFAGAVRFLGAAGRLGTEADSVVFAGPVRFDASGSSVIEALTNGTVTFAGGSVLSGAGSIGLAPSTGAAMQLDLNGLIRADGGTLRLAAGLAGPVQGAIEISGGGTLRFDSPVTSQAMLTCSAGGTLQLDSGGLVTSGDWSCDGTVALGAGTGLIWRQGELSGLARITGDLVLESGRLAPGGAGAGRLVVEGAFTQRAGAELAIGIGGVGGGSGHDLVDVMGAASLAGTLNLMRLGSFVPQPGAIFDVLTAASVTGGWGSVSGSSFGPGRTAQVTISGSAARITVP